MGSFRNPNIDAPPSTAGQSQVIRLDSTVPWATAYAELVAARALGRSVVFMTTDLFSQYELTPGDFNLDDAVFFGAGGNLLNAQAGFHIIGNQLNLDSIALQTNGFVSNTVSWFNLLNSSLFVNAGATPFLCTAAVGFNELALVNSGAGGAANASPLFQIDGAGGFLLVSCLCNSSLGGASNAQSVFTSTAGGNDFLDLFYDDSSRNVMPATVSLYNSVTTIQFAREGQNGLIKTTGGAVTISEKDLAQRSYVEVLANANVTALTLAIPAAATFRDGMRLTVILRQDAAGAFTWPAAFTGIRFPSATPFAKTTGANKIDRIDCIMVAGQWLGTLFADYV